MKGPPQSRFSERLRGDCRGERETRTPERKSVSRFRNGVLDRPDTLQGPAHLSIVERLGLGTIGHRKNRSWNFHRIGYAEILSHALFGTQLAVLRRLASRSSTSPSRYVAPSAVAPRLLVWPDVIHQLMRLRVVCTPTMRAHSTNSPTVPH